jgi:hypothetical protein
MSQSHDREDFAFREDFPAYPMGIFRQKKSLRDHGAVPYTEILDTS